MGARSVLIIGATSAIAAEVARRYAAAGDRLYLIARNPTRLAALVEELAPAIVGHECADLEQLELAEPRIARAIAALGSVDVALIAHGDLGDQALSERSLDAALTGFRRNLLSAVALLIPLANQLELQGSGHLGVITSVAGDRGRPRNYSYGAAKGGLSRYLEGLRSRLGRRGVTVHDFRLGPVDTPMTATHTKNGLFVQPGPVAATIVRGLASRRYTIYVPGFWWAIMLVVRNLPEAVFRRLGFLSAR